jgi:hypothetical protein
MGIWVSDELLSDGIELAGRLAQAFSKTGVWPLLWLTGEDPAAYMPQVGDTQLIDAVDVKTLLKLGSEDVGARALSANPPPAAVADDLRPFERLPQRLGARLVLVPCNRPADSITVLGGLDCVVSGPEISAVLRYCEERFAAIPVAVQPSLLLLAVESPPRACDQAAKLAAEFDAFCPLEPSRNTAADPATALIAPDGDDRPVVLDYELRRHLWPIGWYD